MNIKELIEENLNNTDDEIIDDYSLSGMYGPDEDEFLVAVKTFSDQYIIDLDGEMTRSEIAKYLSNLDVRLLIRDQFDHMVASGNDHISPITGIAMPSQEDWLYKYSHGVLKCYFRADGISRFSLSSYSTDDGYEDVVVDINNPNKIKITSRKLPEDFDKDSCESEEEYLSKIISTTKEINYPSIYEFLDKLLEVEWMDDLILGLDYQFDD